MAPTLRLRLLSAAAVCSLGAALAACSGGNPSVPLGGRDASAGRRSSSSKVPPKTASSELIYVTNHSSFGAGSTGNPSVTVYPASASGDATPIATLSGPATRENEIQDAAVDERGTLWISNVDQGEASGYLTGFTAGAQSGNVSPRYLIGGLNSPEGVAVGFHDRLFVGTIDSVNVYSNHAGGRQLSRSIAGSNTQILNTYEVFVARGSVYLAEQNGVYVFPTTASGNVAPSELITGAATMLQDVLGVAADSAGAIYATNLNANDIVKFAKGANGDAAPRAVITGTALNQPWGIFIDPSNTVYVANRGNNSIAIFAPGTLATGVPTATIAGPDTGLDNPIGVFVK